jgi:cytochrome c biogenesis protein CcdA
MSIILFTLSLALFDSLSTAQQIIIFVLLLTTIHPIRNSSAYLVGLTGAYLACGVVGYLAIDQLQVFLETYFPSSANVPDALYYQTEFISGIVMTLIGAWYFFNKRHAPLSRTQNIVAKFKSLNAFFALGLGAFISASSFPFAIPYIIALAKYATLNLDIQIAMGNILLYNISYAMPMIVIFMIYLYASRSKDDLSETLHERTRVLNVQLTTWAWAGVGIFSIIDALCYFIIDHALVRGRFF